MKRLTVILLLVAGFCSAALIAAIAHPRTAPLFESILLPAFSIFVGLVIGAVGVFLGSIGNLFSLMSGEAFARSDTLRAGFGKVVISLDSTVREIKHNTIGLLALLLVSIVSQLTRGLDLPYITWPFQPAVLSKFVVFTTASLFSVFASFVIVADIVLAMFATYSIYSELAKQQIAGNVRAFPQSKGNHG